MATKTKIVYKAVTEEDGKFFSYAVRGKNRLEYRLGKTTRPVIPNSLIFCYETKAQAKRMSFNVFRCAATGAQPLTKRVYMLGPIGKKFESFWKGTLRQASLNTVAIRPDRGVVGCKSVKLLKRV